MKDMLTRYPYIHDLKNSCKKPSRKDTAFSLLFPIMSALFFMSSDGVWRHESLSTLVPVMACCLMASSQHLNQCWPVANWPVFLLGAVFRKQTWSNFEPRYRIYHSRKRFWNVVNKCRSGPLNMLMWSSILTTRGGFCPPMKKFKVEVKMTSLLKSLAVYLHVSMFRYSGSNHCSVWIITFLWYNTI